MTARELVTSSLRLIGAIAPGDSIAASEAVDGLSTLNALIDSLSNENLLIHVVTRETSIALNPPVAEYTIGTGGSLTTRPIKIEYATIQESGLTVEHPLKMLSLSEWVNIRDKDTQSSIPHSIYEDGGFPLRTVHLYPAPSVAHDLNLYTSRPLTQLTTLDTSLSLPPGYERMLRYNLAIDLAPEYGRSVSAEIAKAASESKDAIKRTNYKPSYLRCDEALLGRGSFNILTGDSE